MDKTPEQINEIVTEFANSILRSLGFEHELSTEKCDAEEISLMIAGPDSRFIIGDGGSRLDDLSRCCTHRTPLAFVWIAITTVSNWSIA